MAKGWYINESFLNDIPNFHGSMIVNGCPGSGKTLMALWKAKEIEETDMGTNYFIVPNKVQKQFIGDGFEEIGLSRTKLVHHREWKNELRSPKTDYLIVDDAQYYLESELREMINTAITIIFFGNWDGVSKVYQKAGEFIQAEVLASYFHLPLILLPISNSVSKKVARVIDSIFKIGLLEHRCRSEGVNKPFLIKADNWSQQLDLIIDIINERGYTNIGILFPSNKLVKIAFEYFNKKGVKTEVKYNISWPEDTKNTLNFHSENPKLMTYNSAQGLRFQVVMLPSCSQEHVTIFYKKLFHRALTRTNEDLYILYFGELSNLLIDVPKNLLEEFGDINSGMVF